MEEFGVVAKHGNAAHEREHRILAGRRLPIFLDFALGRVAVTGDLDMRISAVMADTTIISIKVSVPVLSEQIRDTDPSVSTAGNAE